MNIATSPEMEQYFKHLNDEVKRSYKVAKEARKKGFDPEEDVPIPIAENMAERVVGLISVVAPQILGTKIDQKIIKLEEEYGKLDWRVGFKIAAEVAQEKFCQFESKLEAMEVGIRVGFAYLTLGIVSAPLEGFIGLKLKKRSDGKEYFSLQYAGPIRAAGGTGQSVSVILADYVRTVMGYATYDPTEQEINRYITEVHDYHDRVTNLQYYPSKEELQFMVSHLPVEVDGDPTERMEVSNFKDLPRIETNFIRGGVALVLAEGLSQKASKLWKNLSKWGKDFGLNWSWLAEFLKLKEEIHSVHVSVPKKGEGKELEKVVKPNNTYIMDLVAGRPILTHPLAVGGFRLRYGRGRTCGMYAVGINPATLVVLDKYIAIGTQLKVERPRKGASVTICDTIEGPIVRLTDGSVLQLNTEQEAKLYSSQVDEILFLGDIMFNYGDFSESGHSLVPVGYCPEWWALEVEKAIKNLYNQDEFKKAGELVGMDQDRLSKLVNSPLLNEPDLEEVFKISAKLGVPVHPNYTFYWKLVTGKELWCVISWLRESKIKHDEKGINKIILPYYGDNELYKKGKSVLDKLGVPHTMVNKENVVLGRKDATIFLQAFHFSLIEDLNKVSLSEETLEKKNGLEVVNYLSDVQFKDKAGTFIGARMGRPEKAKMRLMTGSPQVMFPVGEEGDRLRSFQAALEAGKINSAFPFLACPKCGRDSIYAYCAECGTKCNQRYYCRFCGDLEKETCRHGKAVPYKTRDIDINYYFNKAKEILGEKIHPDLIKGIRGTSNKDHIIESLAKGILRAKYNIYVNKDGTTRYDCTELPLTHFKPKEIKTVVAVLKRLGYEKDIEGKELTDDDQILELKPQDVILPGFDSLEESAPKVFCRVAKFVDNLLTNFYGLNPFYNIENEQDLIGHLVIGLAPHISAGVVGRIIGFSETQGIIAHPLFHAGMRRDCDGDEAGLMLLMDALLNFSRRYLPEKRGAKTMDAPLVLTTVLNPAEVDDQVLEMDVVWKYPLELYEAALELKSPGEVKVGPEQKKIEQLRDRLGTPQQYEGVGFTHLVDNFNRGVQCSAYKTLPSMEEKLFGQMELAKKIRAVDMDDVAKLVIQKHFLKDIKGNLRKFSMQQFRCVKCNTKFRRPPLSSKCTNCGGKLTFTISEGSVIKYLAPSLALAEKYDFSPYLKQTLDILKTNVDVIFGKEKEKQVGLQAFVN